MAVVKTKPTSPGRRFVVKVVNPELVRGRTSLFGREPTAGCGLPSDPSNPRLPTQTPPEKSKTRSQVDCLALGQRQVPQAFDKSFCFLRSPVAPVYSQPQASSPWRPTERLSVAGANDQPAGYAAPV